YHLCHALFVQLRWRQTVTLLPYTTLFRSRPEGVGMRPSCTAATASSRSSTCWRAPGTRSAITPRCSTSPSASSIGRSRTAPGSRSEEHTSELQSRFDLVCRLLLEKKKAER